MNPTQAIEFLQGCQVTVLDLYDAQTKHYTWRDEHGEIKGQAVINHLLFILKVYQRNRKPVKLFGESAKDVAASFGSLPMTRTLLNLSQIHKCKVLVMKIPDGDLEIAATLVKFHKKTSFRVLLTKSLTN